jgi:signal transduction histidine kinase
MDMDIAILAHGLINELNRLNKLKNDVLDGEYTDIVIQHIDYEIEKIKMAINDLKYE